jgi:hypothetical protein
MKVLAWSGILFLASLPEVAQSANPSKAESPLPDSPALVMIQSQPQAPTAAPAQAVPTQPTLSVKALAAPQVTILEDTMIRVMTNDEIDSKRARDGTPFACTVNEDVVVGDGLAIPRGATVHGVVVKSKKAGVLTGIPELTLKLVSLDLGGRNYPLYTYQFKVTGTSKTGPTENKAVRGAAVGAIAGSLLGGVSAKGGTVNASTGNPVSMAVGAGIGAGVGTAVSAVTPGSIVRIPSEAQVDFYLAAPITVTKVSAKEAARLEEGLHSGGPSLYLRNDTP